MKPFYLHNYDKVTAPVFVSLSELATYMSDEDADALENMWLSGVGATLTVVREPADKECGIPESFTIKDIDVNEPALGGDYILYKERVICACEDYIYSHEDELVCSEIVGRAFGWLDFARKEVA